MKLNDLYKKEMTYSLAEVSSNLIQDWFLGDCLILKNVSVENNYSRGINKKESEIEKEIIIGVKHIEDPDPFIICVEYKYNHNKNCFELIHADYGIYNLSSKTKEEN